MLTYHILVEQARDLSVYESAVHAALLFGNGPDFKVTFYIPLCCATLIIPRPTLSKFINLFVFQPLFMQHISTLLYFPEFAQHILLD